ncbi:MAG: tetratricopeptide repeat protein [Flavobacteriales bacterium]|nr:tetratricopeptide repeat protein [Flavobacteriales bacterium]
MKHFLITTALVLSPVVHVLGLSRPEADTLTARGATAYSTGDYATALHLFDSVRTAYSSPALLFNIGNCHFKLNDIPHAILFYERALRLAPGDEDVKANLELARQNVVDRVNELPSFTLGSTWGRLRGGRDADQWARRSLWACLLFFALLTAGVLAGNRAIRRALFGAGALVLVATLIAVAFASFRHNEVSDDSEAIILAPKVDVRSEPRESTTVLFVLHKGTKVTVLQTDNGWSEVQLANGSVGWAPPSTLERI